MSIENGDVALLDTTGLVIDPLFQILVEEEAELAVGGDVCVIETDEHVKQPLRINSIVVTVLHN